MIQRLRYLMNIMSQDNRSDYLKEICYVPDTGYTVTYTDTTTFFLGKTYDEIIQLINFHKEILSPDGVRRLIARIKNIEKVANHRKRSKIM